MFTAEKYLGRNVNFTVIVFVKSQILIRLISFPIISCKFCHTWEKSNQHCCHSTQNNATDKSYHALDKPNICSQHLPKGKREILGTITTWTHCHFMFLGHSTEDSSFSLDTECYSQNIRFWLPTYLYRAILKHTFLSFMSSKVSLSVWTLPLATITHTNSSSGTQMQYILLTTVHKT